jgi:hypothetical protein
MTTITQKVVQRARSRYGLRVYERHEWGSRNASVYAYRRAHKPVSVTRADTLVQHITVTRPSGNFFRDCQVVERIGMDRFRSGVSYNFLVNMETGEIAVGQPLDAKGTHTLNDKGVSGFSFNQNLVARAIAVVGMPGTPLSAKAEAAIAGLQAAMMDVGALTDTYDYVPHSFFAFKDCPCDNTRANMPDMRKAAFAARKAKPGKHRDDDKGVNPKPKPKSRGGRVDSAIEDLEGAHTWAEGEGHKSRARRLGEALSWLKKIEAR